MFIEEFSGLVPMELCQRFIARFESSPARAPSLTNVSGTPTPVPSVRSGTQLACEGPEWQDLISELIPALHTSLEAYARKVPALQTLLKTEPLSCTAPVLERVDPGQGFNWHYDQTSHSLQRVIAGLLYLNDVSAGGATEFHAQDRRVQPQTGKIVLFPPFWTHLHRGATPDAGTKYAMSFYWVYTAPAGKAP